MRLGAVVSETETEQTVKLILNFDTINNPNEEWLRFTLPFSDSCCFKVPRIALKYKVTEPPQTIDTISGFICIRNSSRFTSRLNEKGKFQCVKEGIVDYRPEMLTIPLEAPGTENPKAMYAAPLKIKDNENEIKFCIMNGDGSIVKLERGFFIFEITRTVKKI